MANNLGSMILELGANVARFQSDLGKAAHIAQEKADAIKRTFEKVGAAIGVGLGVAEFKEWIAGAIEAQDTALKLSQKIGVSVDAIAGLSSAAQKAGVDQQALQASMVKLSKSAADAAAGVAQQASAYNALGISVKDSAGNLKTSDALLGELADKFAGYKDGVEKTALAVAIFGKAGAQMIPLLNGGSEAIEKQKKLVEDLGAAYSLSAAKSAEEFNDKLSDLSLVSKGVANQIATGLLPALNQLADRALAFFTSTTWKSWLESIRSAADAVSRNLDRILATIKLLGEFAVDYIGVRLVGSIIKASTEMATLAIKTLAANSAAAEMGLSFSTGIAASIKQIGVLNLALGSVGAAVAGIQVGTYLHDNFESARVAGLAFVQAMLIGFENLKAGGQILWLEFQKSFDGAITEAKSGISGLLAVMSNVALFRGDVAGASGLAQLSDEFKGAKSNADQFDSAIRGVVVDYNKNVLAIRENIGGLTDYEKSAHAAAAATTEHGNAALKAAPNVANLSEANKQAASNAERLADMFAKDAEQLASIKSRIDPLQNIFQNYVRTIEQAVDAYNKEVALAATSKTRDDDLAQALANLNAKRAAGLQAQQASIAALIKENDVVGKYLRTIADQSALLGLSDRQKAIAEALSSLTEEWKNGNEAVKAYLVSIGALDPTSEKGRQAIIAATGALYDQQQAANAAAEAARGWQNIWTQAGNSVADTFAKVLVEGGSLFKGLKDLAKQTVEQIIAYFAKLAIINPILNGIFGGGGGFSGGGFQLLPTLASAGTNSIFGSAFGGASSAASGGSSVGASSASLLGMGKTIFTGFQSAWTNFAYGNGQGFGSSIFGSYENLGGNNVYTPSTFGNVLGIAGGIYAGVNRYKQSEGGFAGALGGAAYGLGTLTAAGAIGGIASGAGAVAGATGALGSVGLAAIPIVGWVALAAMLIDHFSGGKLFGTSANKFQGGTQTETISQSGGQVSAIGTFKGQHAFFGGAYYKDKPLDVSDDAVKAAQDFAKALKDATEAFAKSLNAQVVPIVTGVLKTTFDSKGNVTGTESTVLGVTRKETEQQFDERLQADSFLAVLDKMGLGASEFVKDLQGDADALFAGVQDFATVVTAANMDLANGFTFLALSSNATLVDVVKFAEAQQKAGETLTQTYARLEQAQAQYNQFVAQFTPGTQYVDDFEAAFSGLYHQMLDAIDTANELAKAAGAAGASSQDLANIQSAYAQQMAQLTLQLEAAAQSLAFSLGLTTQGSLDQVNDEISRIIGVAQDAADATQTTSDALSTATDSVSSFGSAVSRVAKTASDSVNLLLGNLSPLNDQQKLQIALQGLRAGTVTKEQVLQIGRNLYASSEAYTQLFNSVSRFPTRNSGGGGATGHGFSQFASSSASNTVKPPEPPKLPDDFTGTAAQFASTGLTVAQWDALSAKDKQRLEDLLNQQAALNAAKTAQDFQTLAQQIAEIASAKGEQFTDVLTELGIKQEDLEKGLGLASDEALAAYAANLQKQLDSAGENTQSIVTAITALPRGIFDAFNDGSKPVGGTAYPLHPITIPAPTPNPAPAPPPSGGGGGGTGGGGPIGRFPGMPRMTDEEFMSRLASTLKTEVGDPVRKVVASAPRSSRAFAQ